jgi:hypothetical protein
MQMHFLECPERAVTCSCEQSVSRRVFMDHLQEAGHLEQLLHHYQEAAWATTLYNVSQPITLLTICAQV